MANRVRITNADNDGATAELYNGSTLVKQVRKTYANFLTLQSVVNRWYKQNSVPSFSVPTGGYFSPTIEKASADIQKFLEAIVQELGVDSFPVKYFFRLYDLNGKVVIITGASSGIGKQNAYALAEMGAHVILGCRSEAKTLPIIDDIKKKSGNNSVEFLQLDLLSLQSVKDFVEAFKAKNLPLHILINNAGATVDGLTDYGIDATYGQNQVGPFLLTVNLLDLLQKEENSRIIFVASDAARYAKCLDYDKIRRGIKLTLLNPIEAYSYSKLANICTAKVLGKRFKEEGSSTRAYSLHPGVVATDIWRQMPVFVANILKKFMTLEEEGSLMQLYLAIDDGCVDDNGSFYDYYHGRSPAVQVVESELEDNQKLAWDETSKMCGLAS